MRVVRSALDGMTAAAPRSFKLARSQFVVEGLVADERLKNRGR